MYESSLPCFHGLEAFALEIRVDCEGAKGLFLKLTPGRVFEVHVQRLGLVRDMIVLLGIRIDVQRQSQFSIPLQPRTLIIAFQRL